jgi:hypothetical protein
VCMSATESGKYHLYAAGAKHFHSRLGPQQPSRIGRLPNVAPNASVSCVPDLQRPRAKRYASGCDIPNKRPSRHVALDVMNLECCCLAVQLALYSRTNTGVGGMVLSWC